MKKPKITKTLGPIHFEDLDPHRFEDLIRELIYDFKDWQSIEATGRSGSDGGFDVRAYEKKEIVASSENENGDENEVAHPMEGNLWMIQGKREKEIGPKKLKSFLTDVDAKNPPYGYILAASTNFSKESYDVFRAELRKKGVMEFYLWSKAELEDMLHLPKNDRILFAFFGISLITKRRSKISGIKAVINNKNKLLRILTDGEQTQKAHKPILIRDVNDENYPHKKNYKDFKDNPRWQEHIAFGYIPNGLLIHKRKYYAYIDSQKKEYDFTESVDLINRKKEMDLLSDDFKKNKERQELISKIEYFWNHFPRKNKAKLCVEVSVPFENILIIDEKGDILYDMPHLFVEFNHGNKPFDYAWPILESEDNKISANLDREKYKRIKIFPDKFPKIERGKIHKKPIVVNQEAFLALKRDEFKNLFDVGNGFSLLNIKDIFTIESAEKISDSDYQEKLIFEITHKYITTLKEYQENNPEHYLSQEVINSLAGAKVEGSKKITVFEIMRVYDWKIKEKFEKLNIINQ